MSGYRMGPRPVVLTDMNTAKPVGYKQGNGTETFFPTFNDDWTVLVRPDGSLMTTTGQVQPDWTATEGLGSIINKPVLFDGAYSNLTGRPSYATVASSGDYNDLTNKPTIPTLPPASTQALVTRTLNGAFQPSTTRNCLAFYSVQVTITASIASGQDGELVFEIATNAGFTVGVQTIAVAASSQTYALAVAIQGVQKSALQVCGFIPAGYYARLRTVNTVGTPVFLYRAGQEVLL